MPLPILSRTVDAVEDAINQSFDTYWTGFADDTPIAWPNVQFDPDTATAGADRQAAWVRFALNYTPGLSGPAGIESGSDKVFRRQGIIFVQVFVPRDSGKQRSNVLVERALLYFENVEPPQGVWYRNPGPGPGIEDGGWWQVNVSAEVIYDVLRTQ